MYQSRIIAHSDAPASPTPPGPILTGPGPALILVGPEGGFSEAEVELCAEEGFNPVYLGDRRLRTETAAIAVATLAILGRGTGTRDL
jgi:16S rRNA (uracil1498-N3)-methyltransferase